MCHTDAALSLRMHTHEYTHSVKASCPFTSVLTAFDTQSRAHSDKTLAGTHTGTRALHRGEKSKCVFPPRWQSQRNHVPRVQAEQEQDEQQQGLERFLRSLEFNWVGERKKQLSNLHSVFPVALTFSASLVQTTFLLERERRKQPYSEALEVLFPSTGGIHFCFRQAARKEFSLKPLQHNPTLARAPYGRGKKTQFLNQSREGKTEVGNGIF